MTKELREPPLLSEEEIECAIKVGWLPHQDEALTDWELWNLRYNSVAQAQREADKKWMKEHCYLKAKRELPYRRGFMTGDYLGGYCDAQQDMLKEVDGVVYRACKEFKE